MFSIFIILGCCLIFNIRAASLESCSNRVSPNLSVSFKYPPAEWQTAICLPDDPHKTLVSDQGELLYHYRKGGAEFGVKVCVVIDESAVRKKQELVSPRIPIARTRKETDTLRITQEAFAVTELPETADTPPALSRVDAGELLPNWARPKGRIEASLRHVAMHKGGPVQYQLHVTDKKSYRIALAICEGKLEHPDKRVLHLKVEGSAPVTVDTVAEIGKNKLAALWFTGRDMDDDQRVTININPARGSKNQNAILNGIWVFEDGFKGTDSNLFAGSLNGQALCHGLESRKPKQSRNDLILVKIHNTGDTPRKLKPHANIYTPLGCALAPRGNELVVFGHEIITASHKFTSLKEERRFHYSAALEEFTLQPSETKHIYLLYSSGFPVIKSPTDIYEAQSCRARTVNYWKEVGLPWDRITVPDTNIQAMLDSSIRNIWQAREIKRGLPVFQVGPTCYRGLWIADGAFLLEVAAMLGAEKEARNGVSYVLTHQKEDGRVELVKNFFKENGIVLWTCVQHARLTQDKLWLRSIWSKLERVAAHIKRLRRETLTNDTPLDDGLIPPGFPDGGIDGVHAEYSNIYWNLAGLRAFIEGARWLGKSTTANIWRNEYDDFMGAFQKAAKRDMRTDPHGNRYLPTLMEGEELPQRGQWAFCLAAYPGQVFAKDDPVLTGNMRMLEATKREGIVCGTGWDAQGIWSYFASFTGHIKLWRGDGRGAAEDLYAFANHAAPTLVWREEQSLQGAPFERVGDMPHNWASAELIRLVVHLLALERGDELHLLEGMPREWAKPGLKTALDKIATQFGVLTLLLQISADGSYADFKVDKIADPACRSIVVHTAGWNSSAQPPIRLQPNRQHHIRINRNGSSIRLTEPQMNTEEH